MLKIRDGSASKRLKFIGLNGKPNGITVAGLFGEPGCTEDDECAC